jgi:hypothetical protein
MKLLLKFALLLMTVPAMGTTWHIRLDGGNSTQCTGTTNAAYPGTGTGVACAYNHPFWMMTSSGTWAAAVAGDTIEFDDPSTNNTPYFMGEQNNGVGFDWQPTLSGICPHPNVYDTGGTCMLPVLLNNMTITGQNAGHCHTSGHTGLVTPTVLSGIDGTFFGLNVQGTSGVTISCVEVTQPDTCTSQGSGFGGANCSKTGTISNFIQAAGLNFAFNSGGSFPNGPTNLTLTDFAVVGTAGTGIFGSKMNTPSGGTLNATDIYLIGNGSSGWNGDGGGCNNSCESLGTMNLSYLDIEWNGCMAVKPYNIGLPPSANTNGFNYCFGQNTSGYGDGFVQIAAGTGFVMNVHHSKFKYNTQDGFDAAHLSDDPTTNPSVNIDTSWSEGNAGQTFKIGAGGSSSSSAVNNVSISNCRVLTQGATFPNNPSGWELDGGDCCRAGGDQWNLTSGLLTTLTFENNSSVGYGTVMWDFTCSGFVANCTAATINFNNNLNKGYPDPGNSGQLAAGIFLNTGISSSNFATSTNNLWNTMHTGCPDPSITDPNVQCGDPLLVAESNIDAINPNLTSGSTLAIGRVSLSPALRPTTTE